jgi:hypothetical protein
VRLSVGNECGRDLEVGKRLDDHVPEMAYGLPGKCLDCNPTVLPRWWLGLGPRLFTTGEQHEMCWTVMPLKRAVVTAIFAQVLRRNGRIVDSKRRCHLIASVFLQAFTKGCAPNLRLIWE